LATQYSLNCINNSTQAGSFAVFQGPPGGAANDIPLAWFTRSADPGTQVTFQWNPDHSGQDYWVAFGKFSAGEILDPAAVSNAVEVTFLGSTTSRTVTLGRDNMLSVS